MIQLEQDGKAPVSITSLHSCNVPTVSAHTCDVHTLFGLRLVQRNCLKGHFIGEKCDTFSMLAFSAHMFHKCRFAVVHKCFCVILLIWQEMEFSMSIRMSVSVISHHFDHCCFCILNQLGLDTKRWPNTVTKKVCP